MVFAMRHGVRFYEAMGLNRRLLNFRYGVHIYEATRLQVSDAEGRPVAQSLKGISGLKEMERVVAEGTVATNSTPENLVINVTRLHRTLAP